MPQPLIYILISEIMSIFAALAAKWRSPPKTSFESLWRKMSWSSTESSSSPSRVLSSSAAGSSRSDPRRLERRVKKEPSGGSGDKEIINSYFENAVRDSSKRTYSSFWKRY